MSKHHIHNLAEQLANKNRGSSPSYLEKKIELRAYQIYQEKGGSALDNWLEAERIVDSDDQT